MELALGTVQWGMAYGIAGRQSVVPDKEVRCILEVASRRGVSLLDTAAAYGDIEQRLGHLMNGLPFRVVSKIPPLPCCDSDQDAAIWAVAKAQKSHDRLGSRLCGMLCHRAEDLSGPRGRLVWRELSAWARSENVRLGASVYDPSMALDLASDVGIEFTQLPGNVFDQRVALKMPVTPDKLKVHLRSVFLQGLLLMDADLASTRLPVAANALKLWRAWCIERDMSPLVAALSVVKSFAAVSIVVVGVDSQAQFIQIADAWSVAEPIHAPELAQHASIIIDPRLWDISK